MSLWAQLASLPLSEQESPEKHLFHWNSLHLSERCSAKLNESELLGSDKTTRNTFLADSK